jgi:hypothetical protein
MNLKEVAKTVIISVPGYMKGCEFVAYVPTVIASCPVFDLLPRCGPLSCHFCYCCCVGVIRGVDIEGSGGVDVEVSRSVVCVGWRRWAIDGRARGVLTSCWGTDTRTPRERKV